MQYLAVISGCGPVVVHARDGLAARGTVSSTLATVVVVIVAAATHVTLAVEAVVVVVVIIIVVVVVGRHVELSVKKFLETGL